MKFFIAVVNLVVVFAFFGCGSSNSGESSGVTTSYSSGTSYVSIYSGSTTEIDITGEQLQHAVSSTSDTQTSVSKTAASTTASLAYPFTASFSVSNTGIISISSSASCTFNSPTDICTITLAAGNITGSATLSFTVNNTKYAYLQLQNTTETSSNNNRKFYFQNNCAFDIWLQTDNANAGQVACSTNTDCSSLGMYCVNNTGNKYCVPLDANQTGVSYSSTGITNLVSGGFISGNTVNLTLDGTKCTSGTYVASNDTTNGLYNWGQCTCNPSSASSCPSGQVCQLAYGSTYQCAYSATYSGNSDFVNYQKVAAGTTATTGSLPYLYPPTPPSNSNIIYSGAITFATGCDSNGLNCATGKTANSGATTSVASPRSSVEFTLLTNSNDFIDISYINGVNVPVKIQPSFPASGYSANTDVTNPYQCSIAGGTDYDYSRQPNTAPFSASQQTLYGFGSKYDWNTTIDNNSSLLGYNFVSYESAQTVCTASSSCPSGQVCGLTLNDVQTANSPSYHCGYRVGYWTAAQLCSVNSSFSNSTIGVQCGATNTVDSSRTNLQYILPANPTTTNNPNTCWDGSTSVTGYCAGYVEWTSESNSSLLMPNSASAAQLSGAAVKNKTAWLSAAYTSVNFIKSGGMTAYSYQYDDVYGQVQCMVSATGSPSANIANYKVTFCPNGSSKTPLSGGIASYNPNASCPANVTQSGYNNNYVYIAMPTDVSIGKISAGTKNVELNASGTGTATYLLGSASAQFSGTVTVTANRSTTGTSITCVYNIDSYNSCMVPSKTGSSNFGICATWIQANTPWTGRFLAIGDNF